ncbi:unnamed protein product [Gordionus sp. m RMFG-2023]
MHVTEYVFQIILTPITVVCGLVLNLAVFRRSHILAEIYPPSIYLAKYLLLLSVGGCLAAIIWPFVFNVVRVRREPLSQSLHWLVYMTFFHPIIRSIFVKSRSFLILVFAFERSFCPLIPFWNSIECYRAHRMLNIDESPRSPIKILLLKVSNFIMCRRNRVCPITPSSILRSADLEKGIYRWDHFSDTTLGVDYRLLRNANFVKFLSLICLSLGILFSMPRITWYKVTAYVYFESDYSEPINHQMSSQNPSEVFLNHVDGLPRKIIYTKKKIYSRMYRLKGRSFWIAYLIENITSFVILTLNVGFAVRNAVYYLKIRRYFNEPNFSTSSGNDNQSDIHHNHKVESKSLFTHEMRISQLQLCLSVTQILALIPNGVINLVYPFRRDASLDNHPYHYMPSEFKYYLFDNVYPVITYLELLGFLLTSMWMIFVVPEMKLDWLPMFKEWAYSIKAIFIKVSLHTRKMVNRE